MIALVPGASDQLRFLRQLQRILSDGSFVSTYKYALLHALADLAVIQGADNTVELVLSTRQIAEQMIELYWRQALPFAVPAAPAPVELRQNTGNQAKIITRISEAQRDHGSSLAQFRRTDRWSKLAQEVEQVLRAMPLWKLQTVGNERVSFLYENLDRGKQITLKPGVQYCLRAFYPMILDLIRGAWLRFVRTQNATVLGGTVELSAFLFGAGRASLSAYVPILTEIQDGTCLYCERGIQSGGEVDHFVPWARYPLDLGHNFVLAHGNCNRAKSDRLASPVHLERWLKRNETHALALTEGFDGAGLLHDYDSTLGIARWAYTQTAQTGGLVWVQGGEFHPLTPDWSPPF